MGEVYRARDTRLGRDVAIKVLPADHLKDEVRRRRFAQEARSASALNHPHIVTIHEIESSGEVDFIVMEYVPGQTLDTLQSRPRLGPARRGILRVAEYGDGSRPDRDRFHGLVRPAVGASGHCAPARCQPGCAGRSPRGAQGHEGARTPPWRTVSIAPDASAAP
jgi:hypothetical protein